MATIVGPFSSPNSRDNLIKWVRISLRQQERVTKIEPTSTGVKPSANSISRVVSFVLDELQTSGSLLGYRMMWKRLQLKHKIPVPRNLVSHVLSQLDPEGCLQRWCKKLRRRKYYNRVNQDNNTFFSLQRLKCFVVLP
ncbi:hypothetical protein GBAR_LOCUS16849 [Geodia barretti]|uniref:Uncharacterized protein n=1 Tax=Geodia barretti TaxID=519541 RepID=A0AA35SGK4_GEOBA|nr:hypothetical protein GBAR_LOCUS16849 [Geodia barretti]